MSPRELLSTLSVGDPVPAWLSIAELDDGRILVTEYKGEHLIQYEQEKKNVGELWESKSDGKALFLWAIKKDAAGRDVHRQLEDKIGRRP